MFVLRDKFLVTILLNAKKASSENQQAIVARITYKMHFCFVEHPKILTFQHSCLSYVYMFWLSQIDACNGYYCDGYKPNSNNKPVLWTEDWDGWYATGTLYIIIYTHVLYICTCILYLAFFFY